MNIARKKEHPIIGKRIQYVRMIGGWGYGTILCVNEDGDLIAHLDCQEKGEIWIIPKCAFGISYLLCEDKDTKEGGAK